MNPECVKNENLTNLKEAQIINAQENAVNKLHLSNQKKKKQYKIYAIRKQRNTLKNPKKYKKQIYN